MMTQKERLANLLDEFWSEHYDACNTDAMTEHLLSNGVIVPPCKIGDTVYEVSDEISKRQVVAFEIDKGEMYAAIMSDDGYEEYYVETDLFGEDIFLVFEEAEQALKERET